MDSFLKHIRDELTFIMPDTEELTVKQTKILVEDYFNQLTTHEQPPKTKLEELQFITKHVLAICSKYNVNVNLVYDNFLNEYYHNMELIPLYQFKQYVQHREQLIVERFHELVLKYAHAHMLTNNDNGVNIDFNYLISTFANSSDSYTELMDETNQIHQQLQNTYKTVYTNELHKHENCKAFNFYDIFEPVEIRTKHIRDINTNDEQDKDLKPFHNDYTDSYYEMTSFHISPNDYAFSFYIGCECHSVWGNCSSLHSSSPFDGITLFNPDTVYTRTINGNDELFQVEQTYCQVLNVFKVKTDSPLKFRTEKDFQHLVERFDSDLKDVYDSFVKPETSCLPISIIGNIVYYEPSTY